MAYDKKKLPSFKESIIQGISEGKSLKSILDNNKELPSRPIVYQWLNDKHEKYDFVFLNNYVRAREESADIDAERIQDIAEKTLTGEYDASAARVAIDAFKWNAGKKQPKKYGDKLDLTVDDKTLSRDERIARIAALRSKLNEPQ